MLLTRIEHPTEVEGRPLRTRLASWACARVLRFLPRGAILSNLQAIYNALPQGEARAAFVKVLQKPEAGVLQISAHPELFDRQGNLIDFAWVKEKHICKAINAKVLAKVAEGFGEVQRYRLLLATERTGEVLLRIDAPVAAPPPVLRQTQPSGLLRMGLTADELRTPDGKRKLLQQVMEQARNPVNKAEIVGLALSKVKAAGLVPPGRKGKGEREFKEFLYGAFEGLITGEQVLRLLDGRYVLKSRVSELLIAGRIKELYVDGQQTEYLSTVAMADYDLVSVRVGENTYLSRATNAAAQEQEGRMKLVYDVEGGQAVSSYYDAATVEMLFERKELLLGRAGPERVVYVARRALGKHWKQVYNYGASLIAVPSGIEPERFAAILDRVFSFAFIIGQEAFSRLERAVMVSRIGGTAEEIIASLLTFVPRDQLLAFIPNLKHVFPEGYARLPAVLEAFHILQQSSFAIERSPSTYLQWYTHFFLSYTAGLPVVKLLVADVLQRLQRGEPYNAAKIKQIYLQLLDRTVEIEAAAALKNALFRSEYPPNEVAAVCRGMSDLFGDPFEELDSTLVSVAHVVEADLCQRLAAGEFGREFIGMEFFVKARRKTEASVHEKVWVRKEYSSIEEIWDIFGLQVVTPSAALARKMAVYLAGKYGVDTSHDHKAKTPPPLSPEQCAPEELLRVGDVRGPLGRGIEFYKIQGLVRGDAKRLCRVEIQVHETQMFGRYKAGMSSTAVYNLQKTLSGVEFVPEPLVDLTAPFEGQLWQMITGRSSLPCLIAGIDLSPPEMKELIQGDRALAVRGVLPGTKVAELVADRKLAAALGGRRVQAEVYRYGIDNNSRLVLVPALTDPHERRTGRATDANADPTYELQAGDIVIFRTLPPDPSQLRRFYLIMLERSVNPFARLYFKKALVSQDEFRQAITRGRELMSRYLQGPGQSVHALQGIFQERGFLNLEEFLAALGFGFLDTKEIEAEIRKHSISFTLEEHPGGVKALSVASTDAFGLIQYILKEIIGTNCRFLGGLSYTTVEGGEVRADLVFSLRGRVVLEEDAHSKLNSFIHRQTGVRAFSVSSELYTFTLKRKSADWDDFRILVDLLVQQEVNVLEFYVAEGNPTGYLKVELPATRVEKSAFLAALAAQVEVVEDTILL